MKRRRLEIDVQGEGIVTAADITHDSDVEILNPDLTYCNVSKRCAFPHAFNCKAWPWVYVQLMQIKAKINQSE